MATGQSPASAERELLGQAAAWLAEGHAVALISVLRTWGSSPRPPGSLMLLRGDGRFVGSVSGGCIEDHLLERLRAGELVQPLPRVLEYGVEPGQAERFGLPCGGRLQLLIEPLGPQSRLDQLLTRIADGQLVQRELNLASGEVRLTALDQLPPPGSAPSQPQIRNDQLHQQTFGPGWTLLLIGAGQIARHLARMARMLDYAVHLCDPRPDHRANWDQDDAQLIHAMPDDAVQSHANHPRAAIITLAHDPRVDDLALMQALQSPAFYIGALGSRATSTTRRQRLAQLDLTPQQIARLHAPVGLHIGSHTPAEIALSILAGITAARNGIITAPSK